jgi:hypothetical protein
MSALLLSTSHQTAQSQFSLSTSFASQEGITVGCTDSHQAPSSSDGDTINPARPPYNTASPVGCINYLASKRTISVGCSSPARLTDIDNTLHDRSILAKESPNGVWFLNTNLVIA